MTTNLPSLSVNLAMDAATHAALQQDTGALESAKAYVIDSQEMAELANEDLKAIKARIAVVKQWKAKFVEPAKQIIANAEALFDPALNTLQLAENHHKISLGAWQQEQQRIADERRRQQQKEELERRQKAEREAAAARAKAEEEAREQKRIAEEAERKRLAAIEEGNAKEAARQAAAAAKATEASAAAIETGAAKANELVMSAAAQSAPIDDAPKLKGFTTRDHWKAELEPNVSAEECLERIVAAIVTDGRRDLLALLEIDMAAADKLAKAQKKLMSVPGMVAVNRPVASSRAA